MHAWPVRCQTRQKVTFPAAEHHHPLTDTMYKATHGTAPSHLHWLIWFVSPICWSAFPPLC